MASIEELIPVTKELMGGLISKPKMNDKLLNKPPFRFLHDIVTAVMTKTGFATGLYEDDDLNSGNVKEKSAKLAFLEKIVNCVQHAQGIELEIKPAKVVAGLEPEFTNIFLQEYAKAAGNPGIDSDEAVRRTLAGDPPGSSPLLKGGSSAEAKGSDPVVLAEPVKEAPAEAKMEDVPVREDPPPKSIQEDPPPSKSTRSDDPPAQRESPPAEAKSSAPPRGGGGGWDFSGCDGSVETTRSLMEKLISKPKMSEKLLNKPPFRFLHDVVIGLINNTGFASNLFDEHMSDSSNVKDKPSKLKFLQRIIDLATVCSGSEVNVRAAKVVAGLEAENTNVLLQMLAVIADSGIDCSAQVDQVLGGDIATVTPAPAPAPAPAPTPADMSGFVTEPEPAQSKPTREPEAKSQAKAMREDPPAMEAKAEAKAAVDPFNAVAQAMAQDSKAPLNDDGSERKALRTARPTTARRRPPKLKENVKEVESAAHKEIKNAPTVGILGDDDDESDDDLVTDENDLGAQVPFGNLPTEGQHGKMVQDILNAEAKKDEETKEETKEEKKEGGGIRLGRLGKKKASSAGKVLYLILRIIKLARYLTNFLAFLIIQWVIL
jgi:TRAF3-interacting protein 1